MYSVTYLEFIHEVYAGNTEVAVVLNLHLISLAGVDCWLSLQAVGMEMVDQRANQLNDVHESKQRISVLMRTPFSQHQ